MHRLDKIALGVCVAGAALILGVISYTPPSHASKVDYEKSVVLLSVGGMHGSGVIIDNRRIITAAHVAKEARPNGKMDVRLGDNIFTTATVLWFDAVTDTALLIADGPLPDAQPANLVCSEPDAVVGEQLEAVGNPLGFFNLHTWGRVARNTETYDLDEEHQGTIALIADLTIAPGSSGGPAFTVHHTLAGITNAMASFVLHGGMLPTPALFPLAYVIPKSVICHQLVIGHPVPTFAPVTVAALPFNIMPKTKGPK
jgi:S1-C subfamily serine protease